MIELLGPWRPSRPLVGASGDGFVPSFQSRAVGVAHIRRTAASVSVAPELRLLVVAYPADPLALQSIAVGVGHLRPTSAKSGLLASPLLVDLLKPVRTLASGVGQAEPAVAFVRRSGLASGVQTPLRIEPQRMEVEKDVLESRGNETRNVLQEASRRSAVSDDAGNLWPEPPWIFSACSLPGDRDRLTWEPRHDEIHASAPCCSVEGEHVAPDRSVIQSTLSHVFDQNRGGLYVPLHVADRDSIAAGDADSDVKSAVARTERQDSGT